MYFVTWHDLWNMLQEGGMILFARDLIFKVNVLWSITWSMKHALQLDSIIHYVTKVTSNHEEHITVVLQPHFEASVRMRFALPKVGTWNLLGLPKFKSSISGVKTPCLEVFFIPLERSWSLDVENALHEPFKHLQHKLWSKEGSGVELTIWFPTIKSQESTRPPCV
jgi:hypothetical protein